MRLMARPEGGVEAGAGGLGRLEALDLLDALEHLDGGGGEPRLGGAESPHDPAQSSHPDGEHDGEESSPGADEGEHEPPVDPGEVAQAGDGGDDGVGGVTGQVGDEGVDRGGVVADHFADGAARGEGHAAERHVGQGVHGLEAQGVAQVRLGEVGQADARQVEHLGDGQADDGDDGPGPWPARPTGGAGLTEPEGGHAVQGGEGHDDEDGAEGGEDRGDDHGAAGRRDEVGDAEGGSPAGGRARGRWCCRHCRRCHGLAPVGIVGRRWQGGSGQGWSGRAALRRAG